MAQVCYLKVSLRPQKLITLPSESFGNLESGKHYISFIQKMQSYTCKAKKGQRSSESEQAAEIRIQNPEQWIYLAVKKKSEQQCQMRPKH